MKKSKLTSKYQTTIPNEIRDALNLKPGDYIGYNITERGVIVRKIAAIDLEFTQSLESTLAQEWTSKDDEVFNAL